MARRSTSSGTALHPLACRRSARKGCRCCRRSAARSTPRDTRGLAPLGSREACIGIRCLPREAGTKISGRAVRVIEVRAACGRGGAVAARYAPLLAAVGTSAPVGRVTHLGRGIAAASGPALLLGRAARVVALCGLHAACVMRDVNTAGVLGRLGRGVAPTLASAPGEPASPPRVIQGPEPPNVGACRDGHAKRERRSTERASHHDPTTLSPAPFVPTVGDTPTADGVGAVK